MGHERPIAHSCPPVDTQDEESIMNVITPTTGFGPDKCNRCGAPGFARDAGPNGRKRKGQFFVVTEGWFLKLVILRCSDCDGVFCGGCCRFDNGKAMVECLCPSCGQVLGGHPKPDKRHAELVAKAESKINRTDMRAVKAYFRASNSEKKQVLFVQKNVPLHEVAVVMTSGNEEKFSSMRADGYVKIGVDTMDNVHQSFLTQVVLLDTYRDDQLCMVIYLKAPQSSTCIVQVLPANANAAKAARPWWKFW
jgi:hypothetical protein